MIYRNGGGDVATAKQHRTLHGVVLRDFLISVGLEPTKDNILVVKKMFKSYLGVTSTSALSDRAYAKLLSAITMLSAREFSAEIPMRDAELTMREILNQADDGYKKENG